MSNTTGNSVLFAETHKTNHIEAKFDLQTIIAAVKTRWNNAIEKHQRKSLAKIGDIFNCPLPDLKTDEHSPFNKTNGDEFSAQNFSRLPEINIWEK